MHSLNKRVAVLFGGLVLALGLLAPPAAHADDWNLMTRFQVSHPFEVPGAKLEANTLYVIRLLDSASSRNVVQVLNENQDKLLSMFIANSSARLEPENETVFKFTEMEPGYPLPIEKWFYPGRLNGLEFIYPKDQAAEIALHKRGTATAQQVTREPESEVAQAQEEEGVKSEPEIQREKPAEEPALVEEPGVAEEPAPAEKLPETAGELPLIGLLGLLCLGLGLGLKTPSTRS